MIQSVLPWTASAIISIAAIRRALYLLARASSTARLRLIAASLSVLGWTSWRGVLTTVSITLATASASALAARALLI